NITPATVVTNLATSNQTYQANNDLIVSSAINATTNVAATHDLMFEAGRSILVNANITLNGGSLTARANDSTDGLNSAQRSTGAGSLAMSSADTIDTSKAPGYSVTINVASSTSPPSAPGGFTLYGVKTGKGTLTISGGTSLAFNGAVNAGTG